jgi:hypothetical protein
MKIIIILASILISNISFGQPDPRKGYPKRIKEITEQLKTDSLNYGLIWERLEMKVSLLNSNVGSVTQDQIFSLKIDSTSKKTIKKLYFDEFNIDFDKIYNNIIKEKKYNIVEEGDFYLNRIWFYSCLLEIDKAIKDAKYLRNTASYSQYWQRGEYYNDWALISLFNLYVIDKQYENALECIDTMLENRKKENPGVYFSGNGSGLGINDKIKLFEHFNQTDKIIPFLKKNCKESFNWYFENSKQNNYETRTAREQSFFLLKQIVEYMKKYDDNELLKYEGIYNELRNGKNEIYETVNPNLDDTKLKSTLSKIN